MKKTTIFITLGIVTLIGMINTKIYATERIDSEAIKENSYISMEQEINENKIRRVAQKTTEKTWDLPVFEQEGTLTATLTSDGTLTIVGTAEIINYFDPQSLFGDEKDNIKNVIIEEGVTGIGRSAFDGCGNLTNITIPSSVTSIGSYAFYGCSNLKNITIPSSVTIIGYSAFSGCSSLANITIPNSVTSIEDYAFNSCSSLSNITIPSSVTIIGDSAFSGCSSLANIEIPNTVTNIGDYAFSKCSSLTNITIPSSVTIIGDHAFEECSGLINVEIPKSITYMGSYAFSKCSSLSSINIEEGIGTLGKYTFSECTSLTGVTIPNSITNIGDYVFYECSNLKNIDIPGNVTNIGDFAFGHCNSLISLQISDRVTNIGAYAFSECDNLRSIKIIKGTEQTKVPEEGSIKDGAFYLCYNLEEVTIPAGIKSIDDGAFRYCYNLKDLKISDSVINIGEKAFRNCEKLESIVIPKNVNTIGKLAFYECKFLRNIEVNKDNSNYCSDEGVLFNKSKTTLIVYPPKKETSKYLIPGGVEKIEKYAFNNCNNLENVDISEGVKSIGDYAFYTCEKLKEITIRKGIESIGNNTFFGTDVIIKTECDNTFVQEYAKGKNINTKLMHIGEPSYSWSINGEQTLCTAERICTRDASHKETETAKTTNSVTKEATCEQAGERTYTAIFINKAFAQQTKTEEIQALGHDYKKVIYKWSPANSECTAERICTRDETHKETEKVKATSKVTKDPSCNEKGVMTYTAQFKNEFFETQKVTENIPKRKHIIEIDARIEPTCEQSGKTEGKHCNICNKVFVAQENIPALGHDYEETIIKPTETTEGYTLHTCKRCNKEYKDNYVSEIKGDGIKIKDDIDYVEIIRKEDEEYLIVEPYTTVDMLKDAIIANDEYKITNKSNNLKEGVLATGDKLTVYGKVKKIYVIIAKGDINGDGEVDFINDIVMLNNYRLNKIALSKEEIMAGDINNDDRIDFLEDISKINNYRIRKIYKLLR